MNPYAFGQVQSGPYRVARPRITSDDANLSPTPVEQLYEREGTCMSTRTPGYQLYVGVDIAAKTFTAVWATAVDARSRAVTFAQTPDGFASFQAHLQATGHAPPQTLLVAEATGSYWITWAVSMHQAGYTVAIVNPYQTHQYAASLPRRAKTDALDAHLLAQFAVERQPSGWTPPAQVCHALRQRLLVRDGIRAMRQQARNQRHALAQWPVQVSGALDQLDAIIADLDTRLATLEAELATVLHDGDWAESAHLLGTISGIGLVTSAWLLVATVNFTMCQSAERLAAYAGLVPRAYESGTSVRGRARIGHSGNARLRTVLYLATLTAARFNPVIRAQYERLRAAGKPPKVARCAAARKLLHLAFVVVTKKQPFDPDYQTGRTGPGTVQA